LLHVEHPGGPLDVQYGQCLDIEAGEWVRYSTPEPAGANTSLSVSPPSRAPGYTATNEWRSLLPSPQRAPPSNAVNAAIFASRV
jgi:hypothetical protein